MSLGHSTKDRHSRQSGGGITTLLFSAKFVVRTLLYKFFVKQNQLTSIADQSH